MSTEARELALTYAKESTAAYGDANYEDWKTLLARAERHIANEEMTALLGKRMTEPLFVTLEFIDEQRAAGWPDMHPEDYCHRCGGRNISWWTDAETWNPIMRPDGDDAPWRWNEIVCPQCFAALVREKFPHVSWALQMDQGTRGAKAFAAKYPKVAHATLAEAWDAGHECGTSWEAHRAFGLRGEEPETPEENPYRTTATPDNQQDKKHATSSTAEQ